METLNQLNTRIVNITLDISETYPELSKYLEETKSEDPKEKDQEITNKDLEEYFDLLKKMFNTYRSAHLNTL